MALQIEIIGLQRVIQKCGPQLIATPLRKFFLRAAITVQNRAREKAPVDTGRLRSSIAYEVDDGVPPLYAKVGTNVKYAKPMEYGTGLLSEAPDSKKTRHYPPGGALELWAKRHGIGSGEAVARAIGRRGGLRPRRYLRGALEESVSKIQGLLNRMGEEIRAGWDGK